MTATFAAEHRPYAERVGPSQTVPVCIVDEEDWPCSYLARHADTDVLQQIDAMVEGRCAGPGCSMPLTADSLSAWWCSPECQTAYHRQGTIRPEEVRGSSGVAPDEARWRPDLVDVLDDSDLELLDRHHRDDTGLNYCVYTRRSNPALAHLRVDDGHRFVGMDVEWAQPWASGPSEAFRRLERELTDHRRLDPDLGTRAPNSWSHVLRRMGEVFDREVLRSEAGRSDGLAERVEAYAAALAAGTVFCLPDPPADPEAPTRAELEGGINLTPHLRTAVWHITGAIDAYEGLPEQTRTALEERFRRFGEQVGVAALPGGEALRGAVAGAAQAEEDRLTLRALCSDEAEYERALRAARDHGLTVREVAEMLVAEQTALLHEAEQVAEAQLGRLDEEERFRAAICDWLRANGIDPNMVPVDAAIECDGQTIRCEVIVAQGYDGRPVRNWASVPMTVPPAPEAGVTFEGWENR